METTTYTGYGVSDQEIRTELPAVGAIVVITTGSTKTRDLRHTVAKVTGHEVRSIPGTRFGVWEVVAVAADGEELRGHRVREASAEQAAEFAPAAPVTETEVELPEMTAYHRHVMTECRDRCFRTAGAQFCAEGHRLWQAMHNARHDLERAPFLTVNRWGRTKGHWSAAAAVSEVGINGGEIVKAPAGMVELYKQQLAADVERRLAESKARVAARGGRAPRVPRRRH